MANVSFCDICKVEICRNVMPSEHFHDIERKRFYNMCPDCRKTVGEVIATMALENESKQFTFKPEVDDGEKSE